MRTNSRLESFEIILEKFQKKFKRNRKKTKETIEKS